MDHAHNAHNLQPSMSKGLNNHDPWSSKAARSLKAQFLIPRELPAE
jgi:hypothetical protein